LKKKEERDLELSATASDSREDLEKAILVKMKNVTKADEDVCVAMLESNGYNLKTSVEAFFQQR
jgi:hypothetical protein